jgi:hypothetical protein
VLDGWTGTVCFGKTPTKKPIFGGNHVQMSVKVGAIRWPTVG